MIKFMKLSWLPILFLSVSTLAAKCGLSEKCEKDFEFSGIVMNEKEEPLSDVKIMMGETVLSVTDNNGKYSFASVKTRTWYSGRNVKFVKSGYPTLEAPAFTDKESGPDICGFVKLKRDGVLITK
ncbi:MAG: carboxypeptidase regulatory-like domain-containing protein [Bdellovibrio sp.]|nr:carboxypeptidase regulatory-like domain-containing protein [Bdellovibrio sp.]